MLVNLTKVDTGFERLDRVIHGLLRPSAPFPSSAQAGRPSALIERVAWWTAAAQRMARIPISSGCHIGAPTAGTHGATSQHEVALPVHNVRACAHALKFIVQAVNLLSAQDLTAAEQTVVQDRFSQLIAELKAYAEPGFNHFHLLEAAFRLRLPMSPAASPVRVRLGTGIHSRLMQSSVTDETGSIGMELSQDKALTASVLGSVGLPVPRHMLVRTAADAVVAAGQLGYPVVVKPANLDQGKGVAANLKNEASVIEAFEEALKLSKRVLVEKHFDGFGHRFTVYRGELLSVLKRIPGGVQGDGVHTVEQLLALQLQEPEVRASVNMGRVNLDEEARALLGEQQLTAGDVPSAGTFVTLRRRDNLSAGGRLVHVQLGDVHPDNILLAVRASRALYLDMAGVDILIKDVSISWREAGAVICEVNGRPQFGPGRQGDNFDRVLTGLVGPCPRIPVHLYLCGSHGPSLADALSQLAGRLGALTVSNRDCVWTGGRLYANEMGDGYAAARAALHDRDTSSLLMALTPGELLQNGSPCDCVDSVTVAPTSGWPESERAALDKAIAWTGFPHQEVVFQ